MMLDWNEYHKELLAAIADMGRINPDAGWIWRTTTPLQRKRKQGEHGADGALLINDVTNKNNHGTSYSPPQVWAGKER